VTIETVARGVVVMTVLVLPFVIHAVRAEAAHGRIWTSTSSLVFLSGLVGGLPTALSNLVAPQPETYDAFGNVRVGLSGWAAQLQEGLIAGCLVVATVFFVLRVRRVRVSGGPWLAVALVVTAATADVLHGHAGDLGPRVLVLLALLAAVSVADPTRPAFIGAAAVGLLYAFLGAVQAALHPDFAFRACRPDKCGPGGGLYVGALSNENGLGLVAALSIPFVWLAFRGRSRVVIVGYLAATAVLAGSRTGLLTAVAALLTLMIIRPRLEPPARYTSVPSRTGRSVLVVGLIAAVGAVLPLLARSGMVGVGDRSEFWRLAIVGITESPLLGQGGTGWLRLYERGQIPLAGSYSPHNQWLEVGYAAGAVGLVLFVALMAYLLLHSPELVGASTAILVPVLAASALERPWSFAVNDSLTFTLLAALLCVRHASGPRPSRSVPLAQRTATPRRRQARITAAAR
jgi:hypothetical protein